MIPVGNAPTTCGLCRRQLPMTEVFARIAGTAVCARCQDVEEEHVSLSSAQVSITNPLETMLGLVVQQKHGDPTFNPKSRRLLLLIAAGSFIWGLLSLLSDLTD